MFQFVFRELRHYSLNQIATILDTERSKALEIIEKLLSNGIMRYNVINNFHSTDIPDAEDDATKYPYVFFYVGMALVGDYLIIVYPKYFLKSKPSLRQLDQVFRVLRHSKKNLDFETPYELPDDNSNRLALMLELFDHFASYGIYSNTIDSIQDNGTGSIDWERTINNHLPFLSGNDPIYVDYISHKSSNDERNTITRLHRAVLTEISKFFQSSGISALFGFEELELSDENIENIGDYDSLIWNIEQEKCVQFVTSKIEILELLEKYVSNSANPAQQNQIYCYGTTSFYHIWEDACKVAFGDVLGSDTANRDPITIGDLSIPVSQNWTNQAENTLLDIIACPHWATRDATELDEVKTLRPDIVTFQVNKTDTIFCILDAKYYTPSIRGNTINKQPGVESITKQFLYQRAYHNFVKDNCFTKVINAFLLPTEADELEEMATVTFPEVIPVEPLPFSNKISMWSLPAYRIFDAYLKGYKIDNSRNPNYFSRLIK